MGSQKGKGDSERSCSRTISGKSPAPRRAELTGNGGCATVLAGTTIILEVHSLLTSDIGWNR